MSTNQSPNIVIREKTEDCASCLLAYLSAHGKSSHPYQILRFLAEQTIARLQDGKEAYFNYVAIKSAVAGDTDGDASAWFSRHWKYFNDEFRRKCEAGIQKFAADRGLTHYPWIGKRESDGGAGNQALIYLTALPIPNPTTSSRKSLETSDIDYIPAENLKLSWWARWLFDQNGIAQGWQKHMLVWPPLIWLIIVGLFGALLLFLLGFSKSSVTTQDITLLIYLGLLAWYARSVIDRFSRLVDDRIVMASEGMVGFKEFGVCLELFKPDGATEDTPKIARMIKYAATCPTCGARVLLDKGEPDFPRRIVGRCQESPREHVFSFDRATLTGYRLR